LVAVFEFKANHLGAPAGVLLTDLTDEIDEGRRGGVGLVQTAEVVVGGDAVEAMKFKASEEALDGAKGDGEAVSNVMGVRMEFPELKKASCEEGPEERGT
jgi:hypothetical protein